MHKLILPALLLVSLVGGSSEASAGSATPQAGPEALGNTGLEVQGGREAFSKLAPSMQEVAGTLAVQKTDEAKMFGAGDNALRNELEIRENSKALLSNSKALLSEGTQAKAGLDVDMKLGPKSAGNRDILAKADKNQSLSAALQSENKAENKDLEKVLSNPDMIKNDM